MLTNQELLDSIITEEYEMFKALVAGNYAKFCAAFADIISKLASLRGGLMAEQKAQEECMEDLKAQLERALEPLVEPGGVVVGGGTVELDMMSETSEEMR